MEKINFVFVIKVVFKKHYAILIMFLWKFYGNKFFFKWNLINYLCRVYNTKHLYEKYIKNKKYIKQ